MSVKKLLFVVLTFFIVTISYGDVNIYKKHRILNRAPGFCCWCCIETLGRNQGIKQLYDLAKNRDNDPYYVIGTEKIQTGENTYIEIQHVEPKNGGSIGSVKQKLDALKIKYKISIQDENHLKECCKKNGCVIFMKPNSIMPGPHAVILTDYNDKTFEYLDPNKQIYYKGTREWFDIYWDGVAISLES